MAWRHSGGARSSGARAPIFKSSLHHVLWLWEAHATSLCICIFISKMETITVAGSWDYCERWTNRHLESRTGLGHRENSVWRLVLLYVTWLHPYVTHHLLCIGRLSCSRWHSNLANFPDPGSWARRCLSSHPNNYPMCFQRLGINCKRIDNMSHVWFHQVQKDLQGITQPQKGQD